jgi:hypothetical protein
MNILNVAALADIHKGPKPSRFGHSRQEISPELVAETQRCLIACKQCSGCQQSQTRLMLTVIAAASTV